MSALVTLLLLESEPAAADTAPLASTTGAPATVLSHEVSIALESRRLTEQITWTVRIDDPAACEAGLLTPTGLDGARDGGAMVLEDLLVIPPETAPGATFTLTARRQAWGGLHAGLLVGAPDLPTLDTRLTVVAPEHLVLTVWADPHGIPDYTRRAGSRTISVRWDPTDSGALAQAAWSTHLGWDEAGRQLQRSIEAAIAPPRALGEELGAGVEGIGIAGIVERVVSAIELELGGPPGWSEVRPAAEVASAGAGSAADRAVLMLSLLRGAGFEAHPALFRPVSTPGTFPVTVPVPGALRHPAIVAYHEGEAIYIDPAAVHVVPPQRPASMLGAMVWVPGEIPRILANTGVHDGGVHVEATWDGDLDGGSTFQAALTAHGAALESLRNLLAPLQPPALEELFARLVRQGRPGLSALSVEASGLLGARNELKISLSGSATDELEPTPSGARGEVVPLLAPALAGWLPPRLSIDETLVLSPPHRGRILGRVPSASASSAEATVARSLEGRGASATLHTHASRPNRRTTPVSTAEAAQFLEAEARNGAEVLLFEGVNSATAGALRTLEGLSAPDQATLEALLWFSADNPRRGRRTLALATDAQGPVAELLPLRPRGFPTGTDHASVVAGLVRWSDPEDVRPFDALAELSGDDPTRQLELALALATAGNPSRALQLATPLTQVPDPETRLLALLLIEELQAHDPEGGPEVKLEAIAEAAAQLGDTPSPRWIAPLARSYLRHDDPATARELLQHGADTPLIEALRILAEATEGLAVDEVRRRVAEVLAATPDDPVIASVSADTLAVARDLPGALALALDAARLRPRDPVLWSSASDHALAAGDLPQALAAAARASDLDPDDRVRAKRWALLAAAAGDTEALQRANDRAGERIELPGSIDARMALLPEAPLALLQAADAEVSADPAQLELRAQMRVHAGLLDDAARDGLVLATQHGRASGWALAFAANAGRQYSIPLILALDDAWNEPDARMTRMEYRLITSRGNPLVDARGLDSPRAQILLELVRDPVATAAELEGWPGQVPAPRAERPRGWVLNPVLSSHPGVIAYSDRDAACAILWVGAVAGVLPPPLGLLYTPNPQPIEGLANGVVLQLDGGLLPLYAATTVIDGQEVYAVAFTVEGAKRALTTVAPP